MRAEGVLTGTRFYASEESLGHSEAKRRIVAAKGGETACSRAFDISRGIAWPEGYTGRVLRNAHLDRWLGHEEELAAKSDEIRSDYAAARERGDFDVAAIIAGEGSAVIHDIPPAGEIVERVLAEAERLMFR